MSGTTPTNHPIALRELQYQIAVYHDQTAYKALFLHLMPSLQNFAYSIVKSRPIAEEIASDMLLEVWQRRDKLNEIEHLKLYLLTGVKNAAIKRLKQENKQVRFSFDDVAVEFIAEYSNPSQQLEITELEITIQQAIQALPPRCKMVYKLAKEEKLRYSEIAQLLDISIKTIDNQLSIALKKIAEAILSKNGQHIHR